MVTGEVVIFDEAVEEAVSGHGDFKLDGAPIGHGAHAEDARGAPAAVDALEEFAEARVVHAIDAVGGAEEFEEAAGEIAGAPVGVAAAHFGALEVLHDEVHAIERILRGALAGEAEAELELGFGEGGARFLGEGGFHGCKRWGEAEN